MSGMKYVPEGKRDLRLDFLRGFCLFSMAINHAGLDSYWQIITGGSVFLINAADGFFFISGMTLGIISVGKPLAQAVERLLKRAWAVYLSTLLLSFGFATLVILTGIELWEEGVVWIRSFDEMLEMAVGILTMRHIVHGSDVLIAYVVYLGIALLALWGLHKKRTGLVIGAMVGVYVLSQLSLEMTELPFASFRHLAANNLIFFGGLVIGYYRENLALKWAAWRLSRYVNWLVCGIGIFLLYLYRTDFEMLPGLGKHFADIELKQYEMPPLNLVVVSIYIHIFWLMTTYLWQPLQRIAGWLLIPVGQASLFTFVVHLCLIPIFWNTPNLFDDLSMLTASFWNAALISVLFGIVELRAWVRNRPTKPSQTIGYSMRNLPLVLAVIFMAAFVSLAPTQTSYPAWNAEQNESEEILAEVCRNMFEEEGELEGIHQEICADYVGK